MKKLFAFVAAAFAALTINAEAITVAEAVAMGNALADNAETDTVVVEGYAVNVTPYDIAFGNQQFYLADDAASTTSELMAYRAKPTKNGAAYPVLAGDKVQLKGTIKKYVKEGAEPIIEVMYPSVVFVSEVAGDRTLATTTEITVAKALEIGTALSVGTTTDETYNIVGYVTQIDDNSFNTSYKNMVFWIADSNNGAATNAAGAFEVYRGKPTQELKVGDKVSVKTKIQNYNGTIESVSGVPVTLLEEGTGTGEGESPADVVFTSAEFNGQGTSGTGSQVTATKDGVTFTCDMGFGDQYGVRCYKNSVVTISSANQQIGKIVFEFATVSSTYYNGGLDEEIVVNGMEWSAEGLASQARMNKISIYFGEYDPIVPQGPDTITVAQAVAIAEALAEPAENGQSTTDTKEYVVKGFAVQVYPKNDDGTWSFFMADKAGAYGPFSASNTSTDADVVENDFMLVRGKIAKRKTNAGKIQLQIYKGTGVHGQAPQGIENIIMTEKTQKVIVDGVVYIVRDGKLFNLQGVQVR